MSQNPTTWAPNLMRRQGFTPARTVRRGAAVHKVWRSLVMVTLLLISTHAAKLANIHHNYLKVFVINQSDDVAYFQFSQNPSRPVKIR